MPHVVTSVWVAGKPGADRPPKPVRRSRQTSPGGGRQAAVPKCRGVIPTTKHCQESTDGDRQVDIPQGKV